MKTIILNILKIVNWILALVLILTYVSVHISPVFFWPMAFLGLLFPFLLIVNMALAIYWISRRNWFFLVSLVVLLLGVQPIAKVYQMDYFSGSDERELKPDKALTMLSYNVRIFNLLGKNQFGDDQKALLAFIRQQDPDILCFQEFYINAHKQFTMDTLKRYLPGLRYHHIFWLSQGRHFKYGIATFSKYPIVKKGRVDFGESLNAAIYSDILMDKERIRIYNNHLQSIRFNRNNYRFISNQRAFDDLTRLKEIRDIMDRLKDAFIKRSQQAEKISSSINRSSYPVLVCGDFNDTPVSYTYHAISSGLKDAFVEAGSGVGLTYQGKFPSYRIDYIFYDKHFRIYDFAIMQKPFSDHYPIKASLSLRQ